MKWDFKLLGLLGLNTCFIAAAALYLQAHKAPDVSQDFKNLNQAIEKASSSKLDLSPIKDEISQLSLLIKAMKNPKEVPLEQLLTHTSSELQSKLDSILGAIESLENKTHLVKLLPTSALPFKVISIDSLQHQSIATITYDYKTTALEKGDSLAGWQVTSIDFATQFITFQNDEGCVHVHLGESHA